MTFIKNLFDRLFGKQKPEPKIRETVKSPVTIEEETEQVYYATRPADLPASGHYDGWYPDKIRQEYAYNWDRCVVGKEWTPLVEKYVAKYKANKHIYQQISALTPNKIPPRVIAVIHMKESSMDFETHLHNGDSLARRTVQVPAGMPKAPPSNGKRYTFIESALDALKHDGLFDVKDWSIGNTHLILEKYNGRGYRTGAGRNTIPKNSSPYTYSGTQFYISGQYVKDGKFSPTTKAKNLGCMAFLKALDSIEA